MLPAAIFTVFRTTHIEHEKYLSKIVRTTLDSRAGSNTP